MLMNPIVYLKIATISLFSVLLSSCASLGDKISTWTPQPTLTPTCAPITLSTPVGVNTSSSLIVIVFDHELHQEDILEYSNGSQTNDVAQYIFNLIPSLIKPGDEVTVFQLGYRTYEAARVVRVKSLLQRPEIYNTPSPNSTLTPIPNIVGTRISGLGGIATANKFNAQITEHFATEQYLRAMDDCERVHWDTNAKLTATAWGMDQKTEIANIVVEMNDQAMDYNKSMSAQETPYSQDVVYDGLAHATIDFDSECAKFDMCYLLIIDDLSTWGLYNPNHLEINLSTVNVFVVMPNCEDINQPSCTTVQEYWNREFESFGASSVNYANGERAEISILRALGR